MVRVRGLGLGEQEVLMWTGLAVVGRFLAYQSRRDLNYLHRAQDVRKAARPLGH